MFDKIILNTPNNKENLLAYWVCGAPAYLSKYIDRYILPYSIFDKDHPIPFEIPENTLLIEASALSPNRRQDINKYIECNDDDVLEAVTDWAEGKILPKWFIECHPVRDNDHVITYGKLSEYKYLKIEINKKSYLFDNQLHGNYYTIGNRLSKLYETIVKKCLNT